MNKHRNCHGGQQSALHLDARLAAYGAGALAIAGVSCNAAQAVVVSHTTPQPIGINGEVNIDFNGDGQIDFQVDHDRVELSGSTLDYLQVDKNDINGATNPTVFDSYPNTNYTPFPVNGTTANSDAEYLQFTNSFGDQPGYAVALKAGDEIGGVTASQGAINGNESPIAGALWDWQEGANVYGLGFTSRANRLIDEDAGQIDVELGGISSGDYLIPTGANGDFPDLDDFTGLNGETRYLGVRIDLNDALEPGLNVKDLSTNPDVAENYHYGWIGVQITNEADATGVVTGWGYETTPGMSILAGDTGPALGDGDFDGDGDADGADFLLWQQQFGTSVPPMTGADATNDGMVDGADLAIWESDYGALSLATPTSVAVPEPATLAASVFGALLLLGCMIVKSWRRRRGAVGRCSVN